MGGARSSGSRGRSSGPRIRNGTRCPTCTGSRSRPSPSSQRRSQFSASCRSCSWASSRTGRRGFWEASNTSNYGVFLPEAILVATALASAVLGFAWRKRPEALWALSAVGTGVAIFVTLDMMGLGIGRALNLTVWPSPVGTQGDFAAELKMKVDTFALFFQVMFEFVAFLVIVGSRGFIRPEEPHQGEYYALMLLAVVGMMFTAAATDLFVLFLAFETSSLSTFALVAFRKKDKQATEAAAKFFIIGAVSSGIILFGISLIYGIAGSTSIKTATTDLFVLKNGLDVTAYPAIEPPLIIALVFLIAGFGFKVAVVPFHMWAPDVYQGSPTTISVLLTAASKNVGIVALFRVFLIGLLSVQVDWVVTLAILAIVTQTVGNVLAIPQRSIKRMLAYSSIAQAGYILIALAVGAIALRSSPPHRDNAAAVAVYGLVGGMLHVFVYGAMKAGSFLVVAGTESQGIADDIEAYKGLSRRMPFLAFSMLVFLLSLAGIPPMGGFFSKFVLFSSAVRAASFNEWYLALAVSGVLNSALSLYYYARVIWYMYILEPEPGAAKVAAPRAIQASVFIALAIVMLTAILAVFFLGYLTDAGRAFFGF